MPSVFPVLHSVGPAATASRYAMGSDFLFTATDGGDAVSAYSMDSGEAVWRLEVRNLRSLRAVAGVVIVDTSQVTSFTTESDGLVKGVTEGVAEVFAVDERTGRRLWSHPGHVADGSDRAPLIVVTDDGSLSAYEPVSGAQVWRRTFGVHSTAPIAGGPLRLLVQEYAAPTPGELFLPKHPLSVVDLATGAVTRVGSVGYNVVALIGLGEPLAVVGGESGENERPIVQGGLASRPEDVWQIAAADPAVFLRDSWVCGALLCSSSGNLTTAIDPATGGQVWRADAEWADHRTMRVDGEDLLVAVRRGENGPNTLLLDARTGEVRRDLANWSPLAQYRGRQLMLWTPASAFAPTWIGYVDPSVPGGVRPLFPIGGAYRCSATDRWLFCEVLGGRGQAAALRLDALDGLLA
jgi:hypothetical protein